MTLAVNTGRDRHSTHMCTCMMMSSLHMQHDIVDINEIFRDLGTMVHEQGDMIGRYLCVWDWSIISIPWHLLVALKVIAIIALSNNNVIANFCDVEIIGNFEHEFTSYLIGQLVVWYCNCILLSLRPTCKGRLIWATYDAAGMGNINSFWC